MADDENPGTASDRKSRLARALRDRKAAHAPPWAEAQQERGPDVVVATTEADRGPETAVVDLGPVRGPETFVEAPAPPPTFPAAPPSAPAARASPPAPRPAPPPAPAPAPPAAPAKPTKWAPVRPATQPLAAPPAPAPRRAPPGPAPEARAWAPPPPEAARESRDAAPAPQAGSRLAGPARRGALDPAVEEARELRRRANELVRQAKKRRGYDERFARLQGEVRGAAGELGYHPREVLEVPPVPAGKRLLESHAILPERAVVRILHDDAAHTSLYEVVEPRLLPNESQVLDFLRDTLVRTLEGGEMGTPEERRKTLLEAARRAIVDHSILIDEVGRARVEYFLLRDFLGFGPIDVLMRDPMIEDISCDGPGIPLYLFHRQHESLRTNLVFPDDLGLDSFVIRLAQRSGKHISIAEPLLDATLPDGSRLQATLSREVTTRGSSFTIRKFRSDPLTPTDLIRYGTLSPEMAAYFWLAMENGQSLLLAGGTASGKTTSLNAICQFIPPEKKIVSIEDTREINLSHENWIAGLTRTGFGGEIVGGKPAGTIDMYKLLEAALRQRPEYLLVGEVRGPEALTLFQAMATGHAVYSTMHADSVPSAVYRLENPPINVPRIMLQTLDIVAVQAQARRNDRLVRRIKEVVEVVGFDPESKELLTNTVFEWDARSDRHRYLGKSFILDQAMEKRNLTETQVEAEYRNRVRVIEWLQRRNIRHYGEFARMVRSYYRDPQALLRRVAEEARHGPA